MYFLKRDYTCYFIYSRRHFHQTYVEPLTREEDLPNL